MATTGSAAKSVHVNGKQSVAPNQTLYCTNLNDKIQKEDLRRALYMLFSTYGPVLDIVALKNMKMRGQAHVVFRDTQASSQAMRALQDFEFFGKRMRISYGKGKSDVISRLDGSAKTPEAKAQPATLTETQKSIFSAPASTASAPATTVSTQQLPDSIAQTQGKKRAREEDSDDGEDAMEEDDAMEMSDEDD